MPAYLVLHERNALALDGLHDDGVGLVGLFRLVQRVLDLIEVVAVDDDGVKAEGLELGIERLYAADFLGGAVDLQTVAVHDDGQVIKAVVTREHRGFPDLALFAFAVA